MSNPGSFLCLSLYLIFQVLYLYLRHRLLQVGDICYLYPCLIQTLGNYHFMKVEMIQERVFFKTLLVRKVWQCYYADAKSLWDHASCKEKKIVMRNTTEISPCRFTLHCISRALLLKTFCWIVKIAIWLHYLPLPLSLFDLFQIHGLLLYQLLFHRTLKYLCQKSNFWILKSSWFLPFAVSLDWAYK